MPAAQGPAISAQTVAADADAYLDVFASSWGNSARHGKHVATASVAAIIAAARCYSFSESPAGSLSPSTTTTS
jgi:hypothetical protein